MNNKTIVVGIVVLVIFGGWFVFKPTVSQKRNNKSGAGKTDQ